MEDLFISTLAFIYSITGSYGLSIILLTLSLKFLTIPLQILTSKTTNKVKLIKKEMSNDEKVAHFKKNGINPLIPVFSMGVQIPIYYYLYNVLSNSSFLKSFLWLNNLGVSDPFYILPALTCLTFLSSFISSKKTEQPKMMKKMQLLIPVVSFLFLYKVKGAVLLYMATSSIASNLINWGIGKVVG